MYPDVLTLPRLLGLRGCREQWTLSQARRLAAERSLVRCAGRSAVDWTECFFVNRADHTSLSNFTSEASLLAGTNEQPLVPADYLNRQRKALTLLAQGVLSTTGAPTWIFQVRLGSTIGASTLTGASVGVSPTITAASGVTNQAWELCLRMNVVTTGQGANNTTLNCAGFVVSGGGFASPFWYALAPGTPPTATWTATIDNSVNNWFNLSVTCGTANASNAITCKRLWVYADN